MDADAVPILTCYVLTQLPLLFAWSSLNYFVSSSISTSLVSNSFFPSDTRSTGEWSFDDIQGGFNRKGKKEMFKKRVHNQKYEVVPLGDFQLFGFVSMLTLHCVSIWFCTSVSCLLPLLPRPLPFPTHTLSKITFSMWHFNQSKNSTVQNRLKVFCLHSCATKWFTITQTALHFVNSKQKKKIN